MKRFTLLAACAAVVAILVALVWFVSKSDAPATVETKVSENAPAETSTQSKLAADAPPLQAADSAPEVDTPQAEDVAPRSAAPDLLHALVVKGHVRAVSMCEDPTLEVLACDRNADVETFADFSEDDLQKHVLARASVAKDGSFEIGLPNETKSAHFTVAGRFLYLRKSVELDLSAAARDLVLDADVGAFVQGEIELPAGSPVAVADLDGTVVHVRSVVESFMGGGNANQQISRKTKCKGGAFAFPALPGGGNYRFVIEPEKLAALELQEKDLTACQSKTLRTSLLRGGSIRGIVRSEDKLPVAKAKVEAAVAGRWFGFDNREVRSSDTQDDGTFELAAVTPGPIVMRVTKEGMLTSEPVNVEVPDGGVTSAPDITLTTGNSISGRVTFAEGAPGAGVPVEITFDLSQMFGMNAFNASRGAKGKATAHDDGSFEVTGLGQGPFSVKAEALPPGQAKDLVSGTAENYRARVDGIQPNTKGIELVLRAPIGLRGRIVDSEGAPVKKFKLHAVRPSNGMMGNFGQEQHEQSFDAEDGHFLLPNLETGKWEVFALAEGFAYPDPFALTLPRDDADGEVVISLVRGATVRGRVVSASGAGVAEASVAIDTGEASWKERVVEGPKRPSATSAEEGAYTLAGLRPGRVKLAADSKDYAKSLPVELDLIAGAEVTDIDLVLRVGGTLTGEVFDDTGQPASGLMVQVSDPKNFEQQMGFSDGHGAFKFEHLEPSNWQVVAMPTNLFQPKAKAADDGAANDSEVAANMFNKMKMSMVDIKDGEETHVVLGAPPTDPVKVYGRVTHHGEPFTGAMVIFYREGKGALAGMKSSQIDKDGNYSTVLDTAGPYLANVQKFHASMQQQSVVEFSCDIPKDKEYRLDFTMPTARISGRIRDANGDPAAGARVSLHPESAIEGGTMWGGQYNELAADGDGMFDIQALRPGRYTLLVGGMTFGGMFGNDAAHGREVRGGLSLSEGEWMRDVDFRLKTPGKLEVTVVDGAGSPISSSAVFVRTEGGELVDRFSMVSTDTNGVAVYGGLAPGRYTATARKGTMVAPESARFSVESDVKTPLKIVLGGGTTLVVTLVGEPEKPLKPSVSVTDEDGRELSTMMGLAELMKLFSEGGLTMTERRFGPFPPGRYTIKGSANGKTVTKTVQLTGQAERKLTLRFND